jgi:REP element-mobilizing transposase RayT
LIRRAIDVAAQRNQVHVLACAILADHVHLLVSFRPSTRLSDFVGEVKGLASRTANQRVPGAVRWGRGFYAASLGRKDLDEVRGYLRAQHQRHPDLIPKNRTSPIS